MLNIIRKTPDFNNYNIFSLSILNMRHRTAWLCAVSYSLLGEVWATDGTFYDPSSDLQSDNLIDTTWFPFSDSTNSFTVQYKKSKTSHTQFMNSSVSTRILKGSDPANCIYATQFGFNEHYTKSSLTPSQCHSYDETYY